VLPLPHLLHRTRLQGQLHGHSQRPDGAVIQCQYI
jgi:hypothetical protein